MKQRWNELWAAVVIDLHANDLISQREAKELKCTLYRAVAAVVIAIATKLLSLFVTTICYLLVLRYLLMLLLWT